MRKIHESFRKMLKIFEGSKKKFGKQGFNMRIDSPLTKKGKKKDMKI